MRIAILSDIHANYSALKAVLEDLSQYSVDGLLLLGDLINYGMRPNEVIETIATCPVPVLANIWGNHEKAVIDNDLARFSSDRGRDILRYTRGILSPASLHYIEQMSHEPVSFEVDGRKFLLVHGCLKDIYWKSLTLSDMTDESYSQYDCVISGHSHVPHYLESFFKADCPEHRNKKRTVFINPGSVGQPRNHNPRAQYGVLEMETGEYIHCCVSYDIVSEQRLYTSETDIFYKDRLLVGI